MRMVIPVRQGSVPWALAIGVRRSVAIRRWVRMGPSVAWVSSEDSLHNVEGSDGQRTVHQNAKLRRLIKRRGGWRRRLWRTSSRSL